MGPQLLMLLTLAWVAERRGQSAWSGFWVGTAAALKLFPISFLIYFVVRRRWRAAIACCAWIFALTATSVAVLGWDAYSDYRTIVVPSLSEFRSRWSNASISAFWLKNVANGAHQHGLYAEPLLRTPLLACAGIGASYAAVLLSWFWCRKRSCADTRLKSQDLSFAMTIVAALLFTPVCWDHYLLLLALPLAMMWVGLSAVNTTESHVRGALDRSVDRPCRILADWRGRSRK